MNLWEEEKPKPVAKTGRPRSKYQKRRAARRNGAPMAARPIQPWWITRWVCTGDGKGNPVLVGPWYELKNNKVI